MIKKYSVSLVSYWNTKPFLYGLQNSQVIQKLDLQLDIPSAGGKKILNNAVDIGLVPVAVLAELHDAEIITDYCIGTEGKVKSVCIYSDIEIQNIKSILLDDHSLTSVQLTKILLREYWNISPGLIHAGAGYIDTIKNETAGLIIGDKTFSVKGKFKYVYDLGEAWKILTGLPFVFAAWVIRNKIPGDIIDELNAALKFGTDHIEAIVEHANSPLSKNELKDYLTKYISYSLTDEKRTALALFLEKIRKNLRN